MSGFSEFANKVAYINSRLLDDLSVKIFENRLLFSLTYDWKYIDKIINSSPILVQFKSEILTKILEHSKKDIVAFGTNYMNQVLVKICRGVVNLSALCYIEDEKQKNELDGYPVISISELKEEHINSFVIITSEEYSEMLHELIEAGFKSEQVLIMSHYFDKIINAQYFDIVAPNDSEVFVDAGCLDFSTAMRFIKWSQNNYSKILAFEPSPKQYQVCLNKSEGIRDIVIYPYGLWNTNTELYFKYNDDVPGASHFAPATDEASQRIKVAKLDDILYGQKASFIKMDVEGAELKALEGAAQTIRSYQPKLAISIYHKLEDIFEIPLFILSLNNNYRFYLRHYGFVYSEETVLYAIV